MYHKIYFLGVLIFLSLQGFTQAITIKPYIQNTEPSSAYILWETDSNEESIVEFGITESLGNEAVGISYPSGGGTIIHEVKLEGLNRFTKYFYRAKTNTTYSDISHFKTPPFAGEVESFRMVAMSDMQRDGSFPNKFNEIVEEGVISYLETEFGGDITDNLALVMIPGDLVVTGNNFSQWKEHFFNPSEKLFNQVPVYPVLGNHENNSSFYFSYFKLPENGTPGFEEHWWYKDYSNMRIIGLNSNGPYDGQEQLDWLDNTLANTCFVDSIDFVFAELHHPHKSELWTPGESNFTGQVIERLEQFSTECGKPSVHFFGHTHGYSRGQSRDHKHLWINVATAGGAIDNWGEFPNFDYDEFSVSQDEYGFVVVDVTSGPDPKIHVKRISRGDQDVVINNVLTDSFTIRVNPTELVSPEAISPISEEIAPECVTLVASSFESTGTSAHGQSHWQVSSIENDFSAPVFESWKNFENWYNDIDTQAGDELTDEDVEGLEENTFYFWRVRYRDKELNWSNWSVPASFTTGKSILPENLLTNPGAENDLEAWTIQEGVVESLEAEVCAGVFPNSGNRYFSVGGLCEHSEVGIAFQDIDVSSYIDSITTGEYQVNFGGYLSNYSGSDKPEMYLQFLDSTDNILEQTENLSTLNSTWTLLSETVNIMPTTHVIRVWLKGTRITGTDNDSYFDDLFVRLGSQNMSCENINSSSYDFSNIVKLTVSPNPMNDLSTITLPDSFNRKEIKLSLIDQYGNKIETKHSIHGNRAIIERGNLTAGIYSIIIRDKRNLIGVAKLSIVK